MGFNGLLTEAGLGVGAFRFLLLIIVKIWVKMWKKAMPNTCTCIHKRYVRNFTLHWQVSRWKACETHFQQTYVNGFWFWIESYTREFRESKIYDIFTFLPCSYPLVCGFPTCWHPFHHKGTVTYSRSIA